MPGENHQPTADEYEVQRQRMERLMEEQSEKVRKAKAFRDSQDIQRARVDIDPGMGRVVKHGAPRRTPPASK